MSADSSVRRLFEYLSELLPVTKAQVWEDPQPLALHHGIQGAAAPQRPGQLAIVPTG